MVNKVYQDLEVKNNLTAEKVATEELTADSATLASAIIQTLTAETLTAQTLNAETMTGTAYQDLLNQISGKLSATESQNQDNGWIKFSNGVIMQWGQESVTTETGNIMYPVAFPEFAVAILASCNYSSSPDAVVAATRGDKTYFRYDITRTGGNPISEQSPQGVSFFAIGY